MSDLRALGYEVDTFDPCDRSLARLLAFGQGIERTTATRTVRLARPDHHHVRGERLYQRRAGACVAFEEARVIHMSHRLQLEDGEPIPEIPAPRFLYATGRLQEHAGLPPDEPRAPISDNGTRPRLGLAAVRNVGFCGESAYAYSDTPAAINATPDPGAFRKAYDQRGLDYFRVYESGLQRSDVVAEAMKAGVTVGFGMMVDKAFLDHRGMDPIVSLNPAERVGGHMMAVLEVLENGDVVVDNWWSDWGGDDGTGVISADLFGSLWVSDCYGVRFAPGYST